MISPASKKHPTYRDANGIVYPSVTQILSVVNKPALVAWANGLGLQGIKVTDANKISTGVGTLSHALIEGHITGQAIDTEGYSEDIQKQADVCFLNFIEWENKYKPEYLRTEMQFVSVEHGYGGTIDVICKIDGKTCILDWKSSAAIYPEYIAQVAAYRNAVRKEFPDASVGILRINKDSITDDRYEFLHYADLNDTPYLDYFMACKDLYLRKYEMEQAWNNLKLDIFKKNVKEFSQGEAK